LVYPRIREKALVCSIWYSVLAMKGSPDLRL
jgi:hypothetical protein